MSTELVKTVLALILAGFCLVTQAETVSVDTPRATPAGAIFTVPAGWTITTSESMAILAPPEADSRIAIVDAQARDADGALAQGWAAFRPDNKRPLRIAMAQAPREGWEERRYYEYEVSPDERKVAYAMAWRAGTAWIVVIVDATRSTFEKRFAPFSLLVASLRPKGYQRETFAGRKAHPLTAERIAAMRSFVESGMQQLRVPGVAFSLIDGGKVVFQGGLGVKELGKAAPIDADTLFLAASNTKAITTLLLAQLVDEKRIRWDQPVAQIYPGFRLGDPETTRQVLVRHLVCACTGLPRQDLEWLFEFRQATPARSLALLGTMQPTSRFGEVYQYSNLMAAAAGYVGAAVVAPGRELGSAYDRAVRSRIFLPLGMKSTTFDFARVQRGNHARPHGSDADGRTLPGRMDLNYSILPVRPAGGMWTSARDLSRYVQMELALGKLADGRPLVSQENLLARRAAQIPVGEDMAYGMGLTVDGRWGIQILRHGGSMPGYRSDMMWLPEYGVGAVVLTNSVAGGALLAPFLRRLVEVLFDGRSEAGEQLAVAAAQIDASIAKARERLAIPPDPAEAGKLAPYYRSPALGGLAVKQAARTLVFDLGEWRSTMASRRNDDGTVSFITIDPTVGGYGFVTSERAGKRALVIRSGQHEYVFTEATRP